jgi:hypothetical protein
MDQQRAIVVLKFDHMQEYVTINLLGMKWSWPVLIRHCVTFVVRKSEM